MKTDKTEMSGKTAIETPQSIKTEAKKEVKAKASEAAKDCLLYTSPSPRDKF